MKYGYGPNNMDLDIEPTVEGVASFFRDGGLEQLLKMLTEAGVQYGWMQDGASFRSHLFFKLETGTPLSESETADLKKILMDPNAHVDRPQRGRPKGVPDGLVFLLVWLCDSGSEPLLLLHPTTRRHVVREGRGKEGSPDPRRTTAKD